MSSRRVESLERALQLEDLAERHRRHAALAELDDVPNKDSLVQELTTYLEDMGMENGHAEAAALITSALEEGSSSYEHLDSLGYALLLAAESQKGCSNEPEFQRTMRFLLANNGYTPMRTITFVKTEGEGTRNYTYHFFTNQTGTRAVALSTEGTEVYTALLRDKYRLDDLIDDFRNLRDGTTKDIEKGLNRLVKGGILVSGGVALISSYLLLRHGADLAGHTVGTISYIIGAVSSAIGCVGVISKAHDIYKARRIRKDEPILPYESLTSGLNAVLDAFPLDNNPIRTAEYDGASEPLASREAGVGYRSRTEEPRRVVPPQARQVKQ